MNSVPQLNLDWASDDVNGLRKAYAADRAPPGMNAAAMSTFRLLGDMGYVVGPVLMGVIVDLADAQTAFVVSAGTLLLVGALFARWAPETGPRLT